MTALEFENVAKRFRIRRSGLTLAGWVSGLWEDLRGGSRRPRMAGSEDFWALRGVSFAVRPGEAFGIIGPNGSGKSTTLKILARITQPTLGRVRVVGRVSALLEVGAGFHPELSGRENIYLNASILGMKNAEIDRKLDSIVEFAGLERFIDTPIKRYSTGMSMRLGFAVAAHVEPEVLLVDEVLAVGDTSFQQKCLRRIRELKDAGTAIVFVSHDLATVRSLCDRAMFLFQGEVQVMDKTEPVIRSYYDSLLRPAFERMAGAAVERPDRVGKDVEIEAIRFLGADGTPRQEFRTGDDLTIEIEYVARRPIAEPSFNIAFYAMDGTLHASVVSALEGFLIPRLEGRGTMRVDFPSLALMPNVFEMNIAITDRTGFSKYAWSNGEERLLVLRGKEADGLAYLPQRWSLNGRTAPVGAGARGGGDQPR
ncbi:MAG TPA: ABC transporter ATP-binding protein [Candidatus Methylomirabilis sp.]|jgi:lipopolysaccharide transport system ATP-binding protein